MTCHVHKLRERHHRWYPNEKYTNQLGTVGSEKLMAGRVLPWAKKKIAFRNSILIF